MNTPLRTFRITRSRAGARACWIGLMVGGIPIAAQTATPARTGGQAPPQIKVPATGPLPAKPPTEDVTVLSPFEVTVSNNDIGYYAENTLAGSRLSTNIGDLAASISVVTRQQMLDTASVDMNDVFLYEANTEGVKNFNAFEFNDTGGVNDTNSVSPQIANRIRGIGAADRGRNYYPSLPELPFDIYNTETVEINRGPNSLLFGIGSAAGIVNQSSSSADLKRRMAEVSGRFGSENSYRGSFRFNQPVMAGKLAVFGAAVYDSQQFSRKPSYDISRRAYAAVTYAPFSKTTIKANYEIYNQDIRRPNTVTPRDGISEWQAAGSPSWDPITFTMTTRGVPQVIRTTAGVPVANFPASSGIPLRVGPNNVRPNLFVDHGQPQLWMQASLSNVGIRGATSNQLPILVSSSTVLRNDTTNNPLYIMPGITDRSLYDWEDINIISGQVKRQNADVYNVELHQQLLPSLFAQAGWYREDFRWQSYQYNQEEPVMIDVNTRLLDGTTNPYFGRPFLIFPAPRHNHVATINDNYRLNLAYTFDFTKKSRLASWLGIQRLFVLGARREVEVTNRIRLPVVTSDHSWQTLTNRLGIGLGQVPGNNIIPRIYLGGADGRVSYDPGLLEAAFPLNIPLRHAIPGPTNALPFSNPNNRYTWVNEPATIGLPLHIIAGQNEQKTDSLTLGLQSTWWKDRIVTTLGFRRDKNMTRATLQLRLNPVTGLADEADLNRWGETQLTYGNTYTGGIVVKPWRWLNFTYNQSENFTPAPAVQDLYGELLPLPAGRGEDIGVRIYPFSDNRLVFSFSLFDARADRFRGGTAPIGRVGQVERNFVEWAGTVAQARLGAGASGAALAAEVARIVQFRPGFELPQGIIGTTNTVKARGAEAQLIYSPVRNWNMKATFGRQKSTFSNVAPEFDRYAAERLPIWLAARDTTGGLFWTTPNQPVVNVPQAYWTQSVIAPTKLAKVLEGKRTRNQREWSASLISTYRVLEGRLKGFEFGGGARLTDKAIIGYLGAAPEEDGVIREYDPNKPVYDDPEPAFDFWASRTFALPRFFDRDVRVKLQFNVRNLFENGFGLQPVAVNPDGTRSTFRIVDPREWYLTATFMF